MGGLFSAFPRAAWGSRSRFVQPTGTTRGRCPVQQGYASGSREARRLSPMQVPVHAEVEHVQAEFQVHIGEGLAELRRGERESVGLFDGLPAGELVAVFFADLVGEVDQAKGGVQVRFGSALALIRTTSEGPVSAAGLETTSNLAVLIRDADSVEVARFASGGGTLDRSGG